MVFSYHSFRPIRFGLGLLSFLFCQSKEKLVVSYFQFSTSINRIIQIHLLIVHLVVAVTVEEEDVADQVVEDVHPLAVPPQVSHFYLYWHLPEN